MHFYPSRERKLENVFKYLQEKTEAGQNQLKLNQNLVKVEGKNKSLVLKICGEEDTDKLFLKS